MADRRIRWMLIVLPLVCFLSGWTAVRMQPCRAASSSMDTYYILVREGDGYLSQGRYEAAVECYRRALLIDDSDKSLWKRYNQAYFALLKSRLAERAARGGGAAPRSGAGGHESGASAQSSPGGTGVGESSNSGGGAPSAGGMEQPTGTAESAGADESSRSRSRPAAPVVRVSPDGKIEVDLSGVYAVRGGRSSETAVSAGEASFGGGADGKDSKKEKRRKKEKEEEVYGDYEKIPFKRPVKAAGGFGRYRGDFIVDAPEYRIDDVEVRFEGSGAVRVSGRLTNKTDHTFNIPRVYVRIYDEEGRFRGRNWSYLQPGRNGLRPGHSKRFSTRFYGVRGAIGAVRFEVVTNLRE